MAARVALVDVTGDGHEPRARAFDPLAGAFLAEALIFDPGFLGGAFVAAG